MKMESKIPTGEDEQSNDRAVSPVIGVILMVAITVILAAVIAAFVLDMGGNQNQPAQAGVQIDETTSPHTVTINTMGDNTVSVECSSSPSSGSGSASSVGSTFNCDDGENVVAVNDNGEKNVIQTSI